MKPAFRHLLARSLGPSLLVAVLASCGPPDAPDQSGVGRPLPDTFPVTGVESDLPDGMPLPPEGTSTQPEVEPTPPQPF